VGPVVLSEIMYHPPDPYAGANDSVNEYVELWNNSPTNVPLYDPNAPTNTWRLRNAVSFDFPANLSLEPNGRLLVVGFDPTNFPGTLSSFQAKYGLAPDVLIVGPWNGALNNAGERIELQRPDNPNLTPTNIYVPYYLVEGVSFDSAAPWPTEADGSGYSLQRIDLHQFGDDPANWHAGPPFTGQPTLPAITKQPTGLTIIAGNRLTLTVAATGTEPLTYQWYYNVTNALAAATNATLVIDPVQLVNDGQYQAVVANAFGSVTSQVAVLSVVAPPAITTQPTDLVATQGGQARFTVVASGTAPLSYSWFFNTNSPLPGTSSDLVLINVQPAQSGYYHVLVQNSYGNQTSREAHLTVIAPPVIHPGDLQVNPGDVSITIPSFTGVNYRLEYKDSLNDPSWTPILPASPGTGSLIVLHDPGHSAGVSRFYRVNCY
ncbi:MAG TPA: immunoglobulin domain-containing protein, partial [Verrucomicrobiae bacterium]|nr:immunoglobulin domain-containing protein [Verrucomicrobiae bacterium]